MAALQHVYLTAHGEWTATSWLGERAQCGLRIAIVNATDRPAKGATFTIANGHGDVTETTGTTAGTNGTLTQMWTARFGPVPSSENATAAWQIDLAEDFRTFLVATAPKLFSGFRWTHMKIAPVLADGKYGAASSIYQLTTPVSGSSNPATALPPESALALTLRAPVLGRRGRGRIYIPALATLNGASDGTVVAASVTAFGAAFKTLVDSLNDAPGFTAYVPQVMVTSAGKPTGIRPSEVRVGSHFDVQRRRQAQVPEVYASTAL